MMGAGLEKLVKKWGNSIGTDSTGLGGYRLEISKIATKVDNLGPNDFIKVEQYIQGNGWKKINGEWKWDEVDVECDILEYIDGNGLPKMTELKSSKYTSLTDDIQRQIDRQASLLDLEQVNDITWHFSGRVSEPLMNELLSRDIIVILG